MSVPGIRDRIRERKGLYGPNRPAPAPKPVPPPEPIYQKAKSVPWPWGEMNGSQVPWNADVIIEETWKSIQRIADELGVDPGVAP